jgi:hypothetical protein
MFIALAQHLARYASRFARITGAMQYSTAGTSRLFDLISQLLIEFKKLLVKAGTAIKGVTHCSGSLFSWSKTREPLLQIIFKLFAGASLSSCT